MRWDLLPQLEINYPAGFIKEGKHYEDVYLIYETEYMFLCVDLFHIVVILSLF